MFILQGLKVFYSSFIMIVNLFIFLQFYINIKSLNHVKNFCKNNICEHQKSWSDKSLNWIHQTGQDSYTVVLVYFRVCVYKIVLHLVYHSLVLFSGCIGLTLSSLFECSLYPHPFTSILNVNFLQSQYSIQKIQSY